MIHTRRLRALQAGERRADRRGRRSLHEKEKADCGAGYVSPRWGAAVLQTYGGMGLAGLKPGAYIWHCSGLGFGYALTSRETTSSTVTVPMG
jgi:hypothetical protein